MNSAPSAIRDISFAAAYLIFVAIVGVFAARIGLSQYNAAAAFREGDESRAEAAVAHYPANPDALELRGMLALRNRQYASAVGAFESAIAIRRNDFLLWLRLGYAHLQLTDREAARAAYEKALALAPHYSQPNYYMGRMLLDAGNIDESFQFLSRSAAFNKDLFPEILHHARIAFPNDGAQIERLVKPETADGKLIVARYLITRGFMTDNLTTFLTGDTLSPERKREFIRLLIDNQDFQTAHEVWLSSLQSNAGLFHSGIFDGGFENITESDDSGFGWRIDRGLTATSVARTGDGPRMGANALLIKFTGNSQLGVNVVSQMALLEAGQRYRLKFSFRSPEMISAGLPAVVVTDAVFKVPLGRSPGLPATGGKWIEQKVEFSTGGDPSVVIGIQRPQCGDSPCPAFGELFIDEFSITGN